MDREKRATKEDSIISTCRASLLGCFRGAQIGLETVRAVFGVSGSAQRTATTTVYRYMAEFWNLYRYLAYNRYYT